MTDALNNILEPVLTLNTCRRLQINQAGRWPGKNCIFYLTSNKNSTGNPAGPNLNTLTRAHNNNIRSRLGQGL